MERGLSEKRGAASFSSGRLIQLFYLRKVGIFLGLQLGDSKTQLGQQQDQDCPSSLWPAPWGSGCGLDHTAPGIHPPSSVCPWDNEGQEERT